MPWLRVDEKFSRGRKVKRAARHLGGRQARGRVLAVWVDAMSYCALHLTDGFYPDEEMDFLPDASPDQVFAAMAVGDDDLGAMVERDDARGGWVFRNYAEYQPTKAEVEAKLAKDRERKRGGFRRDSARNPNGENVDSGRTGLTGPDRTVQTDQEPEEPRAVRAPRVMAQMSLAEARPHLQAAAHLHLDDHPDATDGELRDAVKTAAAKLNVAYDGRGIATIVDGVLARRARRLA